MLIAQNGFWTIDIFEFLIKNTGNFQSDLSVMARKVFLSHFGSLSAGEFAGKGPRDNFFLHFSFD